MPELCPSKLTYSTEGARREKGYYFSCERVIWRLGDWLFHRWAVHFFNPLCCGEAFFGSHLVSVTPVNYYFDSNQSVAFRFAGVGLREQ